MTAPPNTQHSPPTEEHAETPPAAEAGGRKITTTIVQLLGFLIGLGMLAWAVSSAFSPENRDGLRRLGEASPGEIAALLSVTVVGFVVSGLMFWLTLRPVRRLRATDVVATNFVAILLSYLPFKLSALFRIAVHRQRDGVPFAVIGPWFGAVGMVLILPTVPMVGFSVIRPDIDLVWLLVTVAGTLFLAGIVSVIARYLGGGRGLKAARSIAGRLDMSLVSRAVNSQAIEHIDESLGMFAGYGHVLRCMGLRVIDIAAFCGRFYVASRILGTPLGFEDALLASVIYFFIGVFFPFGALGAREAGTTALLSAVNSAVDMKQLVLITVVVTGAEVIVSLAAGALGIAWLRPDRLLRQFRSNRREADESPKTRSPSHGVGPDAEGREA
ncbi:MAG: lysylphosphatidylglycerol synthase transmembrane domain-containing protein [Planctomycetota bacterium]